MQQIDNRLLRCSEFKPSLQRFFVNINNVLETGSFVDDYSTTALEVPELPEKFIHQSWVHVGESVVAKSIASLLAKILEMEKVIYHAIQWSVDCKSVYILLK